MLQALINLFKPHKPAPVEVKVEDTVKVEEPIAVVTEPVPAPAPVAEESLPTTPPITPLPQTVSQNIDQWPFPNQAPVEKEKAKPVKKEIKTTSVKKSNSKPVPKSTRKTK